MFPIILKNVSRNSLPNKERECFRKMSCYSSAYLYVSGTIQLFTRNSLVPLPVVVSEDLLREKHRLNSGTVTSQKLLVCSKDGVGFSLYSWCLKFPLMQKFGSLMSPATSLQNKNAEFKDADFSWQSRESGL